MIHFYQGLSSHSAPYPRLRLVIERQSNIVSPEFAAELCAFAEGRTLFPNQSPQLEGPLFAVSDGVVVPGVRMKGGGGISIRNGQFWLEPPKPREVSRSAVPVFQVEIEEDLTVRVAKRAPRALNCLRAEEAVREFDALQALHQRGLSQAPLLAGRYVEPETGEPIRDLFHSPLGVSFSVYDPTLRRLSTELDFQFDTALPIFAQRPHTFPPREAQFLGDDERGFDWLGALQKALREVARVRMRAICEACIGFHSGQFENVLVQRDDRYLLDNLESSLQFDSLSQKQRGPQLLRDLTMDVLRWASHFLRRTYSSFILTEMERGAVQPFRPIFAGLFEDFVEASVHERYADKLLGEFLFFIRRRSSQFEFLTRCSVDNRRTRSERVSESLIAGGWLLNFQPFAPSVAGTLYALLRGRSFGYKGFTLPWIGEASVREIFRTGMSVFEEELSVESNRRAPPVPPGQLLGFAKE